MRKNDAQRIDRRRFLVGSAGALLTLPMLEWYAPRSAFAQAVSAPKRLIVMLHSNGRTAGNGHDGQDNWSPGSKTGPLPATGDISPMLASLGEIRNEIVTIDGVDNLVRHMTGDSDGHYSAEVTCVTCVLPKRDKTGGGPSIDYVAGERLRATPSQRAAVLFPASPMSEEFVYESSQQFYGANGTEPARVHSNPAKSLIELFGSAPTPNQPPATKTLHDRLVARRGSILDAVAKDYTALSQRVSAADRTRLEQHAAFIRNIETRLSGAGGGIVAQSCARPDPTKIPPFDPEDARRGQLDALITPHTIENLVMALACDVTRVGTLHFQLDDYTFPSEFTGASPLGGQENWHALIHNTPSLSDEPQPDLTRGFQFFGKMFTLLVKRLSEVVDVDGRRLLDNTLVMWVSDLGYGSAHFDFNNPVILAGMKDAFVNGQGRHLVTPRRSLGDLYAQVLRMLGGTDTTFGLTGKLGDSGVSDLNAGSGFSESYIKPTLGLHLGTLDL